MGSFDPDAYLAGNGQSGFNPDEYLASKKDPHMGAFGIPEAAANIVTGMGASAVGGLAGAGTFLGGLLSGESAGNSLEAAQKNLDAIQQKFTYQPRSVEGKAISHIAGLPFEYATKLGQGAGELIGSPFGLQDEGNLAGGLAAGGAMTLLGGRAALKSSPNWIPNAKAAFDFAKQEAQNIRAPNAPIEYAPSKMAELAKDSVINAGRIEASNAAKRIGAQLNSGESNPTFLNNLMSGMAGNQEVNTALSIKNKTGWSQAAAKELGIPSLTIDNLKAGRENAGLPYREMHKIKNIASGDEVISAIDKVSNLEGMTPAVADFIAEDVSPLLDKLKTATGEGVNGTDIVNLSRKLRKEANTTYKNPAPEVGAEALADARMAVSKALEDLAAKRLEQMDVQSPGKGYGDLAARLKSAREYIAKSHIVENATNADTFFLDPKKIAKLTAKDNAITGTLADIGKVANNFPDVANINAKALPIQAHVYRTGIPAAIGGAIGFMSGMPAEGAAVGASVGLIGSTLLKKYVTSKGYQERNAIPRDFRPAPTRPQPRIVPINKDIPYNGLPAIPGAMVIPQSWREGINAKMERSPLPVIPDQLLPLSEQYPQGIPIGAAEGRMPQPSTPLPKLYPDNPLLQIADEQPTKLSSLVESIPFDTKFDVANHPLIVKATHDFIDEAAALKDAISAEQNGFKKAQLEAKLRGTENRFMAGWKELGFKNEAQLRDLTQKLYQSGGETQRGIVKTKSLKDLMQ